jgi:hypothetical protein
MIHITRPQINISLFVAHPVVVLQPGLVVSCGRPRPWLRAWRPFMHQEAVGCPAVKSHRRESSSTATERPLGADDSDLPLVRHLWCRRIEN